MPVLSMFTPCGMLALSSEPSHAEDIYGQIQQLYGPAIDFTPGTHAEAKCYATAMALGTALYELDHAGNQASPLTAYELLPLLELDYSQRPGPLDGVPTRQAAVAAAELLSGGAVASNIVNGLKSILGSSFYGYVPAGVGSGGRGFPATVYPASIANSASTFTDVRVPQRTFRLVDPVATTGAAWCAYQNLDPTTAAQALRVGDTVMVQGECQSVAEAATVTAVASTPPVGSNASAATLPAGTGVWSASTVIAPNAYIQPTIANRNGFYFQATTGGTTGAAEPAWPSTLGQSVVDGTTVWTAANASLCFKATFANAHDVGASVIAGNWPYWWSTQRFALIVVSSAAAVDPESRRKVDTFMSRVARGVSQWAIVQISYWDGALGRPLKLAVGAAMGTSPMTGILFAGSN